jgi:hypothetical protein
MERTPTTTSPISTTAARIMIDRASRRGKYRAAAHARNKPSAPGMGMKAKKNARKTARDAGSSALSAMANINGSPRSTTDQLESTRLSRYFRLTTSTGESGRVSKYADSWRLNRNPWAMIALENASKASIAMKKKLNTMGIATVASSGDRSNWKKTSRNS